MDSKIRLCKGINVDREYNNVINYTEQQMLSLCESNTHLVASSNTYSFIDYSKKIIRVDFPYDECLQCNYIAFQNPHYSNKWFFAWIDDVIYKGDKITYITFTIDAWSTWFSNITLKKCFVLREHTNDDTIGKNTLPENVETGEYTNQPLLSDELFNYLDTTYICFAVSERVIDAAGYPQTGYNGIYSGYEYILFRNATNANAYIRYLSHKSKVEAIYNIFLIPSKIVSSVIWSNYTEDEFTFEYAFCPTSNSVALVDGVNYGKTNYLDQDYEPVNKKLLTFPYKFFNISNLAGQVGTYKYEDFSQDECSFTLYGSIGAGCSMKLIPSQYKNDIRNVEEGIDAGKLPICSWNTDPYINWLTQNGVNLAIQTGLGLAQIGIGVATGIASGGTAGIIGAGAAISGAGTINNAIQQVYQHSIQPEQSHGGINQGDYNFADKLTFSIQRKSIKKEYAQIIDDYFTRFGYSTNRIKIPNITGRQYWNYIEIGNIEDIGTGNIPQKFIEEINKACRKGVTIWHNHENIGNFNLNNAII